MRRAPEPRIARPAAHAQFSDHADEAKGDEDDRNQRGFGSVKSRPVLSVEFGGEGAEAQQHKGAELDQHIERDQQYAAVESRTELRRHDPEETSPCAAA